MKRNAFVMHLNPGMEAEYQKRHDEIWPELSAVLRAAGVSDYSIFLDAETLKDAQKHPENYKNLLVRITGYNAYFTSIGRELQNEIIARESHNRY